MMLSAYAVSPSFAVTAYSFESSDEKATPSGSM
jgi:hypothetical protein